MPTFVLRPEQAVTLWLRNGQVDKIVQTTRDVAKQITPPRGWILTGRMKAPSRSCGLSVMALAPILFPTGYRLVRTIQSRRTRGMISAAKRRISASNGWNWSMNNSMPAWPNCLIRSAT